MPKPINREHFWDNVDKTTSNNCWIWTGVIVRKYGRFRGKPAHRIAWELEFGSVPNDILVCHECDNPPCVNPDHLFLGTTKDNAIDRSLKDRNRDQYGEKNSMSILTKEEVSEIFTSSLPQIRLAEIYKISPMAVSMIKLGKTWRHVTSSLERP